MKSYVDIVADIQKHIPNNQLMDSHAIREMYRILTDVKELMKYGGELTPPQQQMLAQLHTHLCAVFDGIDKIQGPQADVRAYLDKVDEYFLQRYRRVYADPFLRSMFKKYGCEMMGAVKIRTSETCIICGKTCSSDV